MSRSSKEKRGVAMRASAGAVALIAAVALLVWVRRIRKQAARG